MIIKIAIPTSDRINISDDLLSCEFFKIIEVECGKITGEIFLQNKQFKAANMNEEANLESVNNTLSGCDFIISSLESDELKNYFTGKGKEIAVTTEKILSNVAFSFISELIRKESNTCCCP